MARIIQVSTREELKTAIQSRHDVIDIIDEKLARNVRIVKSASPAAVTSAIALVGATAALSWNPIGLAMAGFAVTAGGALIGAVAFLIVVIGLAILWAMVKEWNIEVGGEINTPSGHKVYIRLRPNVP